MRIEILLSPYRATLYGNHSYRVTIQLEIEKLLE